MSEYMFHLISALMLIAVLIFDIYVIITLSGELNYLLLTAKQHLRCGSSVYPEETV